MNTFRNTFSAGSSLYMGIGRPEYWDLTQNQDVAPDIPQNNIIGTSRDWEDMMHLKLVNPANMSNGIFRETWTPNTKYDAYRHDWNGNRASAYNGSNPFTAVPADLSQAKYYVITANYNIYICLKQNIVNGVVQASTKNPDTGIGIGTNTGIYKTSDGYYWKFISVTTPADVVNFVTDTYFPVETLTVAPGINDSYYTQWLSQQHSTSFPNGVYNINVISQGTGYNGGASGVVTFPSGTITIGGNGNGCSGTVTFGAGGTVQSIEVQNPGAGYTFLTMSILNGNGFTYDPIFSPAWGLGSDPARDLNAYYVIVNCSLNSSEGGAFNTTNSYRKISLISNPTDYNSTAICTAQTRDATTTLVLTGGVSYTPNETVTDSNTGAKGYVVDWNSANGHLRIIRTSNENYNSNGAGLSFNVGAIVTPGTGIINSITTPQVKPGSGDVVYTEYRTPITRSLGQSENISLVLEF